MIRKRIPAQIEKLQADAGFRELCKDYYSRGYKDWMILMAVFNCMLNWNTPLTRDALRNPKAENMMRQRLDAVDGDSYPAWRFDKNEMDRYMSTFQLTTLQTYGFELRRPDLRMEVVESFLRQRMRHFDLDLPHEPMFGDPPGDWPKV